ncbi:MAG: serine/threonine protein kinase [Frankiales bacterium]|nr:serine/threonine protein kinase [Frankiales bacterium]
MPLTALQSGDPEAVGEHRLLGRLGQGGMGVVYLALDPSERAVAVKVLREGPPDLEGRRRFRQELEALQRVRGHHVVEVLGGDVEADPAWIATRFVAGQRLDDHVERHGPLDDAGLRRLADGLAEALHALHRVGVVHRDLSPGNVLLVDGEPQVIDLGLALLADVTPHTRTGLLLGTAGYLAPEQVVGEPAGPASDVHGWGAVVAFAATGRPPYGTGRPDAVLYRVVHAPPDLDGLPSDLQELVARAMSKDPRARPSPAALGRTLAELPAPAPPPRPAVDPPGVTELLGPQATQVLGPAATRLLHGEPLLDLEPTGRPAQPPTTSVLTGAPPRAGHTPRLPPVGVPAPTSVLPRPAAGEQPSYGPGPGGRSPEPSGSWSEGPDGADPDGSGESRAERRRGTLQAAYVGAAVLALVASFARWAPWLTVAVTLTGLVLVQVAARSRQARVLRRERKGPRGGDAAVALVKLPGQVLLAGLDLLIALPLALVVAFPAALLVSWGLPFGRTWLPDQGDSDAVRATAVSAGLLVSVVLVLLPRRWRGARLLLRRTATATTPAVASVIALVLLAGALGVLACAATTEVLWSPFRGPPFP